MNQYFYRLGHVPELALAEFESLTNENDENQLDVENPKQIIYDRNWLLSSTDLDVNVTGSLVYGGSILASWPFAESSSQNWENLITLALEKIRQKHSTEKKLGIALDYNIPAAKMIGSAKKLDFKKINVIKPGTWPNFGNWKGTNAWLVGFRVENTFYLGQITTYADQGFWNNLDTQMPHSDMRRGLINLKLGRSLLNLVKSKNIWDPFCGQGRVLVAGMDLKDEFWASDVDQICLPELQANWDKAGQIWNRRNPNKAKLNETFALNAMDIDQFPDQAKLKNLAIVTEGCLGFNFNRNPGLEDMKYEFQRLEGIWYKILTKAKTAGIQNLVFCLPYYKFNGKTIYPQFIHNLSTESGYSIRYSIQYKRQDSITGHYILVIDKV